MKSFRKFIITIFLLFLSNSLFAGAFTMGTLQNVGSDGAFDVTRNPATMMNQSRPNAFGFILNGTTYAFEHVLDVDLPGGSSEDGEITRDYDLSGGMSFAYSRKSEASAVGFFFGGGEDQLAYRKIETELSATGVGYKEVKKTKLINPVLTLSYARKIKRKSFYGLQLISSYALVIEESDEDDTGGNTVEEKIETESFSGELGFGYFYKDNINQFGVTVKSGSLNYERSKIEYKTSAPLKGSNEIAGYFYYGNSISISAGAYTFLSKQFRIGFEGGYGLPVYYTQKDYNGDSGYQREEVTITQDSRLAIRGGFEWYFKPKAVFSTGISIYTGKFSRISDGNSKETIEQESLTLTFGFDYYYNAHSRFLIGIINNFSNTEFEIKDPSNDISLHLFGYENRVVIGVTNQF